MKKWFVLGALGVSALFWWMDGVQAVAHVFKAATGVNVHQSAGDLLEDCGYDSRSFKAYREPLEGCAGDIREHIRIVNTRHNLVAVQDSRPSRTLCVAGLLELPDEEIGAVYAGWAKRDRLMVRSLPAELLISAVLQRKYRCPNAGGQQG